MKALAQKLLRALSAQFPDTPFQAQYWTGETEQFGCGEPRFTVRAKSEAAVRRVLREGSLGFGEAYMAGDIEVDGNLQEFLQFHMAYDNLQLSWREKLNYLWSVFLTRNTTQGAKSNVARHYDLGNDFYRLWLDPTMTYTCAYFRTPHDTLEQAQNHKHEHLCRKLRLQPGQTLVDIGCGWGAMMFYAAERYGALCTGYTISERQYAYVQAEIKRRRLQGRVKILLEDYRQARGPFDRFVSIGMFEQVGAAFIRAYVECTQRMLKPGGVGVLHTIGALEGFRMDPWYEKYIFPGAYIPDLAEIVGPMGELQLNVHDVENLQMHYVQTLNNWYQRFTQHIPIVEQMYGPEFVRMWSLYLNLSAAGFRYGVLRLYQITFTHGLDTQLPRTREYLHAPEQFAPFGDTAAHVDERPLPKRELLPQAAFAHEVA